MEGIPLVEVFSVRIKNIKNLYGTIKVTNGLGSQCIYNRSTNDYEPDENALLTGPNRATWAFDTFWFDLDLKDKNFNPFPDGKVNGYNHCRITWDSYNRANVYDEPLFDSVDGQYGSVTVNYAVLRKAAEAKVEVTLIKGKGDRENLAAVYGSLTAHNSIGESELFRKASNEHIDVRPGQIIPLSRSVVAVPLDSSLMIWADLYDQDEIAKGTAEFPAQLATSSEKFINGKYGQIRVRVSYTFY